MQFLTALTLVLGLAAVTTLLFQKLKLPVVLGYILAGLLVGPHIPIPLEADAHVVQTLSELGVILLMFGLGLEFSLAKLFRAAPTAGVTALIQCSVMVLLGFLSARALGWTNLEAIYCGAVVAISSTTIIAKAFDEQGVTGRLREMVVAILIVEDLIAVVLIALLTGVSTGQGLSASEIALTLAKLVGFLVALVGGGLFIVPRVMRYVLRVARPETTILAAIGVCFGVSLLAHEVGYSVALGAFVAGVLVAESGEAKQIEQLVNPVRDVFAAVFFVSVGIMIDPGTIAEHWLAVVVLSVVVIVGKIVSVTIGAFFVGSGTRTSVAAGMSLAQIGEFSFIIAGVGMSLGAVGEHLYPVAVAVSAVTTLTTPWLIRGSDTASRFVDATLPRPLQTFVSFYEDWIERLRTRRDNTSMTTTRRLVSWLALDIVVVAALVIAVSLGFEQLLQLSSHKLGLERGTSRIVIVAAAGALALPFCVGILRTSRAIALHFAAAVVPTDENGNDLGQAPRKAIAAALSMAGVAIAGLPLVALTQPFLSGFWGIAVLGLALLVLAVGFWRNAQNLDGHVRAVSNVVIEALVTQSNGDTSHANGHEHPFHGPASPLLPSLPGMMAWQTLSIAASSGAVGRSLADLAVRGATGATVLAVVRNGEGAVPDAHAPLEAGDVLAISGTEASIAAAVELLSQPPRA